MNSHKVGVVGIVFQNQQGEHYYSKYYTQHSDSRTSKGFDLASKEEEKKKFERGLLDKVSKMNVIAKLKPQQNQIFSFSDFTVLVKVVHELIIFLVCEEEENYFLMEALINCLGKVLLQVTKDQWTGKTIYDNLDAIILVTDELVDEGLIVQLDPDVTINRMRMRDGSDNTQKKAESKVSVQSGSGVNVSSAFSNIFGFAKSSLQKTLNLG